MTGIKQSPLEISAQMSEAVGKAKAWTLEEARRLIKRYEKSGFPDEVLFETGYGPIGPSTYRYLWRGRAHVDGAARI